MNLNKNKPLKEKIIKMNKNNLNNKEKDKNIKSNPFWTMSESLTSSSKHRRLLILLFMMVIMCCIVVPVKSWDCVCNPRECEVLEPSGCPGMGVIVWDPCRCCKICSRTLGESCGGFTGTCEPGLKCIDGMCGGNS